MKIKTQDLIDEALDLAVAECVGLNLHIARLQRFSPSLNWSQGGPIIERERLHLIPMVNAPESHHWECSTLVNEDLKSTYAFGPTALIAAMRCYVKLKLGEELEIPEELK